MKYFIFGIVYGVIFFLWMKYEIKNAVEIDEDRNIVEPKKKKK